MTIFNGLSSTEAKVLKRRIGEYVAKRHVTPLFVRQDFARYVIKGKRTLLSSVDRAEVTADFLAYLDRWYADEYSAKRSLITVDDVSLYVDFSINNAFHRVAKKYGYDTNGIDVPYVFERTKDVERDYNASALTAYHKARY